MWRMILISSLAYLLAACGIPRAADYQSGAPNTRAQEDLACADVGISPGSDFFSQCVIDLHNNLWAEQNLEQN